MEWLYIILLVVFSTVLLTAIFLRFERTEGLAAVICVVGIIASFLTICLSPASYYSTRNDAIKFQAYYDMVQGCVVEEHDDYVVVTGLDAAMWQAGSVSDYNSYVRSIRYWDSIPVIQWCVYSVSDELKEIRLVSDN